MKKNLAFVTSTLLAVGLFANLVNNQGNIIEVKAIGDPIDVTIERVYGQNYSAYGCYYVCFVDATQDTAFRFWVEGDDEVEANHSLTKNKIYTLDDMNAIYSYATISDEDFKYDAASLKLYSDEHGYVGYEAEATLKNGVYYSFREAEPMSGEMVIDEYKIEMGSVITLNDTETGSKFYFHIKNIEDGATYTLSDFSEFKYCYIGGYRSWDYREATFKRTTDDAGLIHVEATVLTEHGDSLSLRYDEPEPIAVTGVALNKISTTLKFGGSETLVATVSPEDAANKSVTWSSNNENVVTVDENGVLSTVAVGSATITVTTVDGNHKATCDVTVTESALSVTNKINALPDAKDVTLNDETAIKNARAAYDSLDADEKALVLQETLQKLIDAEEALAKLKAVTPQGLSGGAIAGIVIGSILGLALIACGVLFILHKKGIIVLPFLKKERKSNE